MKLSVAFLFLAASVEAFAPTAAGVQSGRHHQNGVASTSKLSGSGGMSNDVGIPCKEECALESFPNLPESIHPGVLSGQAMMDLLQHAKENGTYAI